MQDLIIYFEQKSVEQLRRMQVFYQSKAVLYKVVPRALPLVELRTCAI